MMNIDGSSIPQARITPLESESKDMVKSLFKGFSFSLIRIIFWAKPLLKAKVILNH